MPLSSNLQSLFIVLEQLPTIMPVNTRRGEGIDITCRWHMGVWVVGAEVTYRRNDTYMSGGNMDRQKNAV